MIKTLEYLTALLHQNGKVLARTRCSEFGGIVTNIFVLFGLRCSRFSNPVLGLQPFYETFCTRFSSFFLILLSAVLCSCATKDRDHAILISIPDQELVLFEKKIPIARYAVSTSKFGVGSGANTNATPLGKMEIARKIGDNAFPGTVFKDRIPTGEIIPIDAPGRDPIVTRILWLRGLEPNNANTFARYIYIHGTPEERNIGTPTSYGCIRMRSRDVIELYNIVGNGASVEITDQSLAGLL